jgi:hypothetical protein
MEHTFSSKQIVSKVTRKYESLLDLAFLKVYLAKFYQVSDYRLSRASSLDDAEEGYQQAYFSSLSVCS